MEAPLNCDAIIRQHQRAEAEAYFHRLYLYFRWRPWEDVAEGSPAPDADTTERLPDSREDH